MSLTFHGTGSNPSSRSKPKVESKWRGEDSTCAHIAVDAPSFHPQPITFFYPVLLSRETDTQAGPDLQSYLGA